MMMPVVVRVAVCLLGVLVCASMVYAQTSSPPATQPSDEPNTVLEWLKQPPDQGGGLHFSKHFSVVFGGIKQGSGIALGPAVSWKFEDGGFAQIKAEYSVRKFMLLQGRYDTR